MMTFPLSHWSPSFVQSIQFVELTIPAGANTITVNLSNPSTVPAATTILLWNGMRGGDNTLSGTQDYVSVYPVISGTDITGLTATTVTINPGSVRTVRIQVVEIKAFALKSPVQYGIVTLGSGTASGTQNIKIGSVNPVPTAGGSGYLVGDIVNVVEAARGANHRGQVRVDTIGGGGTVTGISLVNVIDGGYGYTTGVGKTTTGGTGSGLTIEITSIYVIDTNTTVMNFLGCSCDQATDNLAIIASSVNTFGTTNVQGNRGVGTGIATVNYCIAEFCAAGNNANGYDVVTAESHGSTDIALSSTTGTSLYGSGFHDTDSMIFYGGWNVVSSPAPVGSVGSGSLTRASPGLGINFGTVTATRGVASANSATQIWLSFARFNLTYIPKQQNAVISFLSNIAVSTIPPYNRDTTMWSFLGLTHSAAGVTAMDAVYPTMEETTNATITFRKDSLNANTSGVSWIMLDTH